ncbi:hypothetical protein [Cognatilysobacter lacus]|uniref:Uncharacterized protein n=1 Tax=Cognatilysobacter lacus TaxID=1643323 RepID=A0A5D8Z4U2_9GAMM|nr:hypothetical protein [Lysobacter lacus]TZF90015.1 hypothetical protein FW784_07040 [Lysobacter lacus]
MAAVAMLTVATLAVHAGQPVPKKSTEPRPPAPATATAEKADTTLQRMEATPPERREELRAIAKTAAEQADRSIREMQLRVDASWARMTAESRRAALGWMSTLRTKRQRLGEQIARLDGRSNAALGEVKAGVVAAYREFTKALERTREQMQSKPPAPPAPARPVDDQEKTR